jgi:hypothetical protein
MVTRERPEEETDDRPVAPGDALEDAPAIIPSEPEVSIGDEDDDDEENRERARNPESPQEANP